MKIQGGQDKGVYAMNVIIVEHEKVNFRLKFVVVKNMLVCCNTRILLFESIQHNIKKSIQTKSTVSYKNSNPNISVLYFIFNSVANLVVYRL